MNEDMRILEEVGGILFGGISGLIWYLDAEGPPRLNFMTMTRMIMSLKMAGGGTDVVFIFTRCDLDVYLQELPVLEIEHALHSHCERLPIKRIHPWKYPAAQN